MRKHRLYVVAQIGLWKYFIAVLIVVLSTVGFAASRLEITPASVSVSGYTRANGTRVSSYSRRPAGSVAHDAPFETLDTICFLADAAGAIWLIVLIYRAAKTDHVLLFLKGVSLHDSYPQRPLDVEVPYASAKARKPWACERCSGGIRPGSVYYFVPTRERYSRRHYCAACRNDLAKMHAEYGSNLRNFLVEHDRIKALRIAEFQVAYRKKFHHELVNPEKYL